MYLTVKRDTRKSAVRSLSEFTVKVRHAELPFVEAMGFGREPVSFPEAPRVVRLQSSAAGSRRKEVSSRHGGRCEDSVANAALAVEEVVQAAEPLEQET